MGTLCTQRSVRVTTLACLLVAALCLVLARPAPAQAAGVVGDGTAGSCTDAALSLALVGGGGVSFNCGSAPVTITVGSTKDFFTDTTIDGGGLVTLSGGDAVRVLKVEAGATLVLNNLTVSNGFIADDYGGGIRNSGVLIVNNSRVVNNQTTGGVCCSGGGGIRSDGTLTITNSQISGNASSAGGGISIGGPMAIVNSQIWGNTADESGGGVFINIIFGGNVSISGGAIFSNTTTFTTTTGGGAGIYNVDTLSLDHVDVVANTTADGANSGGGILNTASGTMTLTSITLSGNSARYGGGLYNSGTATLTNVTLSGNSASYYGGGIDNDGTATLTNVTLRGNSTSYGGGGGGINNNGTATLNNSTLSGNSAGNGGGIYNHDPSGIATLNNSTLSGNSAVIGSGGGIFNKNNVSLLNVTLSNNSATQGGALSMQGPTGAHTLLTNTIIAYSPAGGNCNGQPISAALYSISSDHTCALTASGLDPLLTALGNYGGPTLVHMLKVGSPAIDGVVGNAAPASTDQRGLPRPVDGTYDIGAVERQLLDSDLAPRLYLPLIRR